MSLAAAYHTDAKWLVHINQQVIKANRETGSEEPPISVVPVIHGEEGEAILVRTVITGGVLHYSPKHPMDVGATLYLVLKEERPFVTLPDGQTIRLKHPSTR